MNPLKRKEPLVLLLGDVFFLMMSLWLALFLRTLTLPSRELFLTHLSPFGLLFIIWIAVFYIAGLYEKRTLILRSALPGVIFNTQAVNSIIGVLFFYFIPYFGITPKTVLFIYLIVSFVMMILWRVYGYFYIYTGDKENALIIGSGQEMKELVEEVNTNPFYNLKFISSIDLEKMSEDSRFLDEVVSRIYSDNVSLIAIDLSHKEVEPVLPHLYNLIFSKINFIDMHKIYEDVFDRVPLSLLKYNWFLENISTSPRVTYDALKRIMDIVVALVLGILSLILYPFVFLAIKLDDGGSIFSFQKRVGQNNKIVNIIKFRTMTVANDEGKWDNPGSNKVTRIGKFLRETRIDELPQLWNVLRGDVSLIGPRPEFPEPVREYSKEISYYNVRHIIKPGLSGWAQIYGEHPHHGTDVSKTKNKLSYDLYYIKNRSLLLDLKILLRTIRTLLSRAGR
jgi:exopolysaccharide biosynthesis polyprenyl glycosylphosphotransferase